MAQGEFSVERQLWSRWPKVVKVIRTTESGREERRYVRKGADWEAKDYAVRKVAELQAENAKLRELCATVIDDWMSKVCPTFPFCEYGGEYQDCTDETCGNQIYKQMARELGVEVEP